MPLTNKEFDQVTVLSRLVETIKEMPIVKQHALLEELRKRTPQFKREHRSIVIRSRVEPACERIPKSLS